MIYRSSARKSGSVPESRRGTGFLPGALPGPTSGDSNRCWTGGVRALTLISLGSILGAMFADGDDTSLEKRRKKGAQSFFSIPSLPLLSVRLLTCLAVSRLVRLWFALVHPAAPARRFSHTYSVAPPTSTPLASPIPTVHLTVTSVFRQPTSLMYLSGMQALL